MVTEVKLQLTSEDRKLVAEYGYPFEDLANQLRGLEKSERTEEVTTDDFYLGNLLADLVRSMKETDDDVLLQRLDELYYELESQAAGQGVRIL